MEDGRRGAGSKPGLGRRHGCGRSCSGSAGELLEYRRARRVMPWRGLSRAVVHVFPGVAGASRLMPSGPMLNWRMAGAGVLAPVLTMGRDRLMGRGARWEVSASVLSGRGETADCDSPP